MRKKLIGVVTSDRNSKTRRVDVDRLRQHSKYKKIVRARTVCYVHDENNESKMGDTVEIVECRPRSKTKRWELARIIYSEDPVASQLAREKQQEEQQPQAEAAADGEPAGEQTGDETVPAGDDETQTPV
jgi:small subunit ribosomal protein S17